MILASLIFLWCLIGYLGIIYDWTRNHDLKVEDAILFIAISWMGIIILLIGLINKDLILMKRRNKD